MTSLTESALALKSPPPEERLFHMFPMLPIELRRIIWTLALNDTPPRLVNIERKNLKMTVGDWETANGASHREDIFVAAGIFAPGHYNDYEGGQTRLHGEERRNTEHRYAGEKRLDPNDRHNSIPLAGFKNRSIHPPLLFVSREAHSVASHFYQLAFSCLGSVPETYFNFEKDTLLLRGDTFTLELPTAFSGPNWALLDGLRGLWGMSSKTDMGRVKHLGLEINLGDELDSFLANLLEDFCNLETLTLVVGRIVRDIRDWSSICFVEPISRVDIAQAMKAHQHSPADHFQYQNMPILCCHKADRTRNQLGMDSVEDYIEVSSKEGDNPGFSIPNIYLKKLTSKFNHEWIERMQTSGQLLIETTVDLARWEEHGGGIQYYCEPRPLLLPNFTHMAPIVPPRAPAGLVPTPPLPAGPFAPLIAPANSLATPPLEAKTVESEHSRNIMHLPNGRPVFGNIQIDHFAGLDKTRFNDEDYILGAILNDPGDDFAFDENHPHELNDPIPNYLD